MNQKNSNFMDGNLIGCTHLVFIVLCFCISKAAVLYVKHYRFSESIKRIQERIELERLVIDHFCFEDEDFTYEDEYYEVQAQKKDEKVYVSINGIRSYRFSYDIIDDGSFNLTKMED
ncbi:hypothetical protein LLS04_08015 [Erysipelothrix enhydrae]|uniref:hypothetical protein n=1 Tax=Erysipelothrix enhydrae TaxID=2890314 RepID=UPI002B244DDC|nr:hypothetical protein [Erysipelothrix sp. 4322-04]WRB86918.1 hypothetical protein LLS04_08015 [Erysipelothrix sp. 4322-04]